MNHPPPISVTGGREQDRRRRTSAIGELVDRWIGELDWWIGGLVDWIGGLVDWWVGELGV
jgi:hypothetical protein